MPARPTPGVPHAVRVGASARELISDASAVSTARSSEDARPLTVFRYDFRASNADEDARASVTATADGAVEVTYEAKRPRRSDSGADETSGRVRYRGMRVREGGTRARGGREREHEPGEANDEGEVECALVFDGETGTFTLERVEGTIGSLRIAREERATAGAGELGDAAAEERARREREANAAGDVGVNATGPSQLPSSLESPSRKKRMTN